jgi:hypothetical protein
MTVQKFCGVYSSCQWTHVPSALPLIKSPGIHWIGGCACPRASLDNMKTKFLTVQPIGSCYTDCATMAHGTSINLVLAGNRINASEIQISLMSV